MSLRVLHTADWHLGGRLGDQDRTADKLARVGEVLAYAEAHQVDAMLVCGDVLDELRTQRLAGIVKHLGEALEPSVSRGMQCVFLAGRRDSLNTFELFSGLQGLLGASQDQVRFVSAPKLLSLTGATGESASLVALPYPDPSAYGVTTAGMTLEQKHAQLQDAVIMAADRLAAEADEIGEPKLLAGHFPFAEGQASDQEQVVIDPQVFSGFTYVALGHSHQAKVVSARVRYSGAIERNDFSEMSQPREALLVTITGDEVPRVESLPLDPTPMTELEVRSSTDLAETAEQIPDLARTLVKLVVRLRSGEPLSPIRQQAVQAFPRLIKPESVIWLDAPNPSVLTGDHHLQDFEPTVRDYLAGELQGDPDRQALLDLAETLLAEPAETEQ